MICGETSQCFSAQFSLLPNIILIRGFVLTEVKCHNISSVGQYKDVPGKGNN